MSYKKMYVTRHEEFAEEVVYVTRVEKLASKIVYIINPELLPPLEDFLV